MIECTAFLGGTKWVPKEMLELRPAVYAIILDRGQLLLVKNRNSGKYALPGGGIEIGERIETALKREVREETGLEIEVGPLLDFQEDFFYYDPSEKAFHSLLFLYQCTAKTFTLLDNDQIDDEEAMDPQWIALQHLSPEQLQYHGETILKIADSLIRQHEF